jgi:hypothetical protein
MPPMTNVLIGASPLPGQGRFVRHAFMPSGLQNYQTDDNSR